MNSSYYAIDINVLRLRGLQCGLVIDGDVVHDVWIRVFATVHAFDPGSNNVCHFVTVGRIVANNSGVCACQNWGVTVGVLQAFTCQCGTPGSSPNHEASDHLIAS